MQSRKEFLEKLEHEMVKKIERYDKERAIFNLLPENIDTSKYIHVCSYKSDAHLSYGKMTKEQVINLMRALPPIAMLEVRNGWLSFFPSVKLSRNDLQYAQVKRVAPFVLELVASFYQGVFYSDTQVRWFTAISDKTIKVTCGLVNCATYIHSTIKTVWGKDHCDFKLYNKPVDAQEHRFDGNSQNSRRYILSWGENETIENAFKTK